MSTDAKYQPQVTTQQYGAKPMIEGIELIQLPYNSDDGGNFSEIFRLNGGVVEGTQAPFIAQQISLSVVTPGAIKAYHLHYKQDDLWYVAPYDRLLVNLHDVREGSATFDVHQKLVLGGGRNQLLRIPTGVAHGVANVYDRNMTLIYATSEKFNAQDPDEHRLPWDVFGADAWEITKG
jgi:dTDP-4-dehydrorhamnose 3,5-epimerase